MKIIQNITKNSVYDPETGVKLEILHEDIVSLRIDENNFTYVTNVSKKLLLEFLKHLELEQELQNETTKR